MTTHSSSPNRTGLAFSRPQQASRRSCEHGIRPMMESLEPRALLAASPFEAETHGTHTHTPGTHVSLTGAGVAERTARRSDDTTAGARPAAAGNRPKVFRGTVGSTDANDYYVIRLKAPRVVRLSLDQMSADADIELMGANGNVIASSRNARSDAEVIQVRLDAGRYFVRVFAYSGTTAYSHSGTTAYRLSAQATKPTRVPALASRPGARHTIYLDFDGDLQPSWSAAFGTYRNVQTPGFGGDAAAMQAIFAAVAQDYAAFDVNVTTIRPSSFADGAALHVVVGGNGDWLAPGGGVLGVSASIGAYANSYANTVFVFAGNFPGDTSHQIEIGNTISHEAGHALGLEHFSYVSSAIMGTPDDFPQAGPNDEQWWSGINDEGNYQDDGAVLTSVLGAASQH